MYRNYSCGQELFILVSQSPANFLFPEDILVLFHIIFSVNLLWYMVWTKVRPEKSMCGKYNLSLLIHQSQTWILKIFWGNWKGFFRNFDKANSVKNVASKLTNMFLSVIRSQVFYSPDKIYPQEHLNLSLKIWSCENLC